MLELILWRDECAIFIVLLLECCSCSFLCILSRMLCLLDRIIHVVLEHQQRVPVVLLLLLVLVECLRMRTGA